MVERSWAQFFNEKIIDSNSERAFKGILHFCVTGFTISGKGNDEKMIFRELYNKFKPLAYKLNRITYKKQMTNS